MQERPNTGHPELFSTRANSVQASAIREICQLIARPEIKSLAGGWPDPLSFPIEELRPIINKVLDRGAESLQYTTSEGLPQLRSWLANWTQEADALTLAPEQIVITHGSAQSMELVAKVFIEPGDVGFVGLPSYFGGAGAIKSFQGKVVGVPVDEQGMRIDLLEEQVKRTLDAGEVPKLVYMVPDFQNPSGATLPMDRRLAVVELAKRYNLIVVEDSAYRDLRYSGSQLPTIMSLDEDDRVFFLRSFSKTFCPGFRLAYAAGPAQAIRKMVVMRQFEDCCTNAFGQHVLYEFCKDGHFERQIERNRHFYLNKRDAMAKAIGEHFPEQLKYTQPDGGFFFFIHLPDELDGEALLREAVEEDVAFVAGAPFFVDGSGKNTLRLSFSQIAIEEIDLAIATLGKLLRRVLG